MFVAVSVIVALGWGVSVGAGMEVDVGNGARAPQAKSTKVRIIGINRLKLTFCVFIVFSFSESKSGFIATLETARNTF